MPTFTPAQAKKILKKRGITDPAVIKRAIKVVERRGPKKVFQQIPRTQQVVGAGGRITRGPSVEGFPIIPQIPIAPSRAPAGVPIVTGFGPAGLLGSIGTALARLALRAPGTRQVITGLAGRATGIGALPGPGLGTIARVAGTAAVGAGLTEIGSQILERVGRPAITPAAGPAPSGGVPMHPGTGRGLARLPGVGGMLPPGTTIVKTWNTGTAQFARLADGRIAVQRKDGSIKVYRPQKHIVIPRNPRVGTLLRAEKRLDRLAKGLRKMVRSGKR